MILSNVIGKAHEKLACVSPVLDPAVSLSVTVHEKTKERKEERKKKSNTRAKRVVNLPDVIIWKKKDRRNKHDAGPHKFKAAAHISSFSHILSRPWTAHASVYTHV